MYLRLQANKIDARTAMNTNTLNQMQCLVVFSAKSCCRLMKKATTEITLNVALVPQ